jgi:hypothetical protein
MDISKLVEQYSNDMELGAKVRELYCKEKELQDKLMEETKNLKIYESPDGGKTVYERPFGGEYTERKLIKQ